MTSSVIPSDESGLIVTLADGHHELTDLNGNKEVDDVESDKESYCEEVDEIGADGQVHHIKKWHHHTVDHFKNHGHKWGALSIVGVALGLGLGLGLAVYAASKYTTSDSQNKVAAKQGTTMGQVSVIPSKGEGSSNRRLDVILSEDKWDPFSLDGIRAALKSTTATPPEELDPLSDYHLQLDPGYLVSDPSASTINTLNQITCYLDQLRVSDVGLNLEGNDGNNTDAYVGPNPDLKPYVAVVDPGLCGIDDSNLRFAVTATGPTGGGPGLYQYNFVANMGEQIINGEVSNNVGDCSEEGCRLLTSSLSYYFPEGEYGMPMKGALKVDKTNPSLHTVKFAESLDFEFLCWDESDFEDMMPSFDDDYFNFDDDWMMNYDDDFEWDDDWWDDNWDDDWGDDYWSWDDNWDDDWSWDDDDWWSTFDASSESRKSVDQPPPAAPAPANKHSYMRRFAKIPGDRASAIKRGNEGKQPPRSQVHGQVIEKTKKARRAVSKFSRHQSHLGKSKAKLHSHSHDKYLINPTAPLPRRPQPTLRVTAPSNRHKEKAHVKSVKMKEKNLYVKSLKEKAKDMAKSKTAEEKKKIAKAISFLKGVQKKERPKSKRKHLRHEKKRITPLSMQGDWDSPEYYNYYLNSNFNPDTFDGAAICQAQGEAEYRLLFSEDAFLRSKNNNEARCIDFSVDNRMLVTTGYKLFDAGDGSEVIVESGYIIQKEVNGVVYEAYVDYWGAWAFYSYDSVNGWSYDDSWLVDGASVEKVDYATGNTDEYTLKMVEAKLLEVTTYSVTLDELKDAPLLVNNYAADGLTYKISWDGENLVQTSEYTTRCILPDYSQWIEEYPYVAYELIDVATNEHLSYQDCACLDTSTTPATIKKDGSSMDWNYWDLQVEQKLSTPTTFTPSTTLFPYMAYEGFLVTTESYSVFAEIDLEYESVQTLYGVRNQKYVRGDHLRQESSGATGVVVQDSAMSIRGYSCGWNCITLTSPSWWTCDDYSYTTSYLLKGMKLTQGDVIGFVEHDWVSPDWEPIPIKMHKAGESFDLTKDIEVSMPTIKTGELVYYSNVTGTLTAPSVVTVSPDWQDFAIVGITNCTDAINPDWAEPFESTSLTVIIENGGSNTAAYLVGSIYESWQWGFVINVGDGGCDPDNLSVTVSAAAGSVCSSLPNVTLSCVGYSDKSDRVKVRLPRNHDAKFEYSWQYDVDDKIMKASSGSSSFESIGWTWWVEENMGELYPITGNTNLTYRTERVVNPDATIPSLLCYDDCPDASKLADCQGSECKRGRPTRLSSTVSIKEKAEGCTGPASPTSYPSWTFSDIGGTPSMNVTWIKESETGTPGTYNYRPVILVGDVGMNCSLSSEETPTVAFDDSASDIVCSDDPEVTISCQEGNDVIDFRQAYGYSFNSDSGVLTDSTVNQGVLFTGTGNTNYDGEYAYDWIAFGPFFPDDGEKLNLACPEDPGFVCMRDAEKVLSKVYYYEAGRWAQRAVLVDANGNALNYAHQKTLLYTHSGETSNTGKSYDGSSMFITYDGPRAVQGLPQFCLSQLTGRSTDVCIPPGSERSTTNGNDISINTDAVLTDAFGNKYYMKPITVSELYPVASDASICDHLDMDNFVLEPPIIDTIYSEPSNMCNEAYPSSEDLKAYLDEGMPQVIGGLTRKELAAASIAAR